MKSKILMSVRRAKHGVKMVIHNEKSTASIFLSSKKTAQLIAALNHLKSPNRKLSSDGVLASCDEVVWIGNCKAGLK